MLLYNLDEPKFREIADSTTSVSSMFKVKTKELKYGQTHSERCTLLAYDKTQLSPEKVGEYGWCRSVILNSAGKVVSFSPPKSYTNPYFFELYPTLTPPIVAEEVVDGTMINLFYNRPAAAEGDSAMWWEVATRNTLGADCRFYDTPGTKTFREMFVEAVLECNLNLDDLDKDCCYSFVLQHPDHPIVTPIAKPQLYLVAVYRLCDGNVAEYVPPTLAKLSTDHRIQFPTPISGATYREIIDRFEHLQVSPQVPGVMFRNACTGEKTKVVNPRYTEVHLLRGNQPKLQFQYLALRKEGKVREYLNWFPAHKPMFALFRDQVHRFTEALFQNYLTCFVKKERPLVDMPPQFHRHLQALHRLYLTDLRPKQRCVNNTVVQQYVNQLPTPWLMHTLNYDLKQSSPQPSLPTESST